jgi:hypothetical protein
MKTLFKNVKLFGIFVVALSLLVSLSGFPLAVSAQTAIETDFMNIMNAQRIALGKNSLAINSSLSTAAYLHSKDMAENNYFSHVSLDGRTMVQRVTAAGYMNWTSLGENIAYCYGAPDANIVYDMWKNSPGHYANMIGNFADAGLGVFTLNNYTYYTLDLGENMTPGSSDATLSNLTISSGTLTPGFTSWNTGYIDSVGNGVNSVTVAPTVNQANATVTVNGTGVTSGTASGAISLAVGPNTITVKVTAQDGSTTDTYTIVVTRSAAAILAITTSSPLPNGQVGVVYSGAILTATGGTGSYTWSVQGTPLPDGLTLNATTGAISGTPTVAFGPTMITFKVIDSATPTPNTATLALSLTINPTNTGGQGSHTITDSVTVH